MFDVLRSRLRYVPAASDSHFPAPTMDTCTPATADVNLRPFHIAVTILLMSAGTLFGSLHWLRAGRLQRSSTLSEGRHREIHFYLWSIIRFNWAQVLVFGPLLSLFASFDISSNADECLVASVALPVGYLASNLFKHHVMIGRSVLAHPDGVHRKLRVRMIWVISVLVILFAASIVFRTVKGDVATHYRCPDGRIICGANNMTFGQTVLAVIEFMVSITSLTLYLQPLLFPLRSESAAEYRAITTRTLITSAFMIATSLTLFVSMAVVGDRSVIDRELLTILVASDMFLNMCFLNATWTSQYYFKIARETLGLGLTSSCTKQPQTARESSGLHRRDLRLQSAGSRDLRLQSAGSAGPRRNSLGRSTTRGGGSCKGASSVSKKCDSGISHSAGCSGSPFGAAPVGVDVKQVDV
uniref:Transmembrane protein n=1 Tax=Lotharella oceanica TaxID=641309 RepID=A0A7S2U0I1_9EUKA|mmetsp:Transcript_4566/g.9146  ORF Transcript_4566/g.9146 Transcript_4566/m.9146 type:complete len:412 (+) Transcript_4566:90-1325(+)